MAYFNIHKTPRRVFYVDAYKPNSVPSPPVGVIDDSYLSGTRIATSLERHFPRRLRYVGHGLAFR
jgi:hypothetical protein